MPGIIVQHKWDSFARSVMLHQFYQYFMLVILFTAHVITASDVMYTELRGEEVACFRTCQIQAAASWILWVCTVLATGRFITTEFRSFLRQSLGNYLEDAQNIADFFNYLLLIFSLVGPVVGYFDVVDFVFIDTVRALASVCVWFCMLYRLQAFDRLQKLVYVIFEIIADPNFLSFMTTTLIILLGFAVAFYLILRNVDPMMNDLFRHWDTPVYALLSSWNLMLGDFDMDQLMTGHIDEGGAWFDAPMLVVMFLFVLFTFFITSACLAWLCPHRAIRMAFAHHPWPPCTLLASSTPIADFMPTFLQLFCLMPSLPSWVQSTRRHKRSRSYTRASLGLPVRA
jgi:hypothetical protein